MNAYKRWFGVFCAILCCFHLAAQPARPEWPAITQQNKPWSRWWWEGSAVNQKDLAWMLKTYQQAGLGGLEVTAIYGVKGYEKQFIDYLSPKWMDMLSYTLQEAQQLDLGIDVAQASGWPFGGPWVKEEDASKYLAYKKYTLQSGKSLIEPITYIQKPILRVAGEKIDWSAVREPVAANTDLQRYAFDQVRYEKQLPLQTLMAYSDQGDVLDLTNHVDAKGKLQWKAPNGNWTLYALFQGLHGKMVERAGPGGEGYAIDHFSKRATEHYLNHFTTVFKNYHTQSIRAFFNDSYEVDDANGEADWTPWFFDDFKRLRGYDLRSFLPTLLDADTTTLHQRVLCDYRETISDLLLENYTQTWHQWASERGTLIRNQAHGSPANILDLYAATDIPEGEGTDILRIKFASSAAHVMGKPLASSESATWNNEHFISTLADVKTDMDRFLLGGINHMFYHGTAYTPQDAPWPGWLFYAAVHFTPNNPFWTDFSKLNRYVARCQSFMQQGKPHGDVLLYLPIYDAFSTPGKSLLQHFDGIEKGFKGSAFEKNAEELQKRGFSFDFISDKQIQQTIHHLGHIATGGITYQTLVVPGAERMPLETLSKLMELASNGATIIFYGKIPNDVPGLHALQERQKTFKALTSRLHFISTKAYQQAKIGEGRILVGDDLEKLLDAIHVKRETMVDQGLQVIRRDDEQGSYYFIKNGSDEAIDGWVPVQCKAKSVALFDPMTEKMGYAAMRTSNTGDTEVYLQLKKGTSCILQTFNRSLPENAALYTYQQFIAKPQALTGTWSVQFVHGGPTLPAQVQTRHLKSWTEFNSADVKNFSGTAHYTLSFPKPVQQADAWLLDLGQVCESARVLLNGDSLATLIGPIYQVVIPTSQLKEHNILTVEVSNSMANRIAYMDRQGLPYRIFYNTNMPARLPQNRGKDGLFTAVNWSPQPSGLLGPVTYTPIQYVQPD